MALVAFFPRRPFNPRPARADDPHALGLCPRHAGVEIAASTMFGDEGVEVEGEAVVDHLVPSSRG